LALVIALLLVTPVLVGGSNKGCCIEGAPKATITSAGAAKAAVSLHQRARANTIADFAAGINAQCIDKPCMLVVLSSEVMLKLWSDVEGIAPFLPSSSFRALLWLLVLILVFFWALLVLKLSALVLLLVMLLLLLLSPLLTLMLCVEN